MTYSASLRRLYFVRFAFALVWVAVVFAIGDTAGPLLTTLLVIYPLFDALAVLWQPDKTRAKTAEWVNVVVSVAIAIALGISSSLSISAAVAVWGAWAIVAGVPQLIAAIRNRRNGGQVPQMLSGGISVFAGLGFLYQGVQGSAMVTGAAGYAALGAVFFLVSAIRLSLTLKKENA
jgi:uncharacterized membrane protein HdeD (DUF308 family)